MFRLRFKKESRPFPPHIVSRWGKSDRCEWKYATIFIHKKSKENSLTPEGIQKRQNKCIPTLTMVRKKKGYDTAQLNSNPTGCSPSWCTGQPVLSLTKPYLSIPPFYYYFFTAATTLSAEISIHKSFHTS